MSESIKRRGFMLVLSSPSGAGKTAIAHRILETEDNMSLSVSVTTRSARPGEINGKDYFFVDRPAFDGMVQRDEFLEHAEFCGNCYGTPREPVRKALAGNAADSGKCPRRSGQRFYSAAFNGRTGTPFVFPRPGFRRSRPPKNGNGRRGNEPLERI